MKRFSCEAIIFIFRILVLLFVYCDDIFLNFATHIRGSSSVGRALASQAKGHGFESRLPLGENDGIQAIIFCNVIKRGLIIRDPFHPFQGLGV